jgi:catechol 2,3-dioxygenase-like lactoylglutathione lyase family enzyme
VTRGGDGATWTPNLGVITLFVQDVARSREFYGRLLDAAPVYEDGGSAVFAFGETLVNLLQVAQAPELIDPAPVAPHDSGSRALLTAHVDDVDAVHALLRGRGIGFLNGPMDRPWGVRTAAFTDPDGHTWEIATR